VKAPYPTLEEAHPNEHRPADRQMALALLFAMQQAARQGNLKITVPESMRGFVNTARRHNFRSE